MPTIAITGAAGDVGRVVADAFPDHETVLLTHGVHDELDNEVLEMTDREAFAAALDGVDVLVHLAWASGGADRWDETRTANVRGTENALAAARANDLDRVVLASSVHVTGMYNRDDPAAGESLAADPTTAVHPADPVRPDSLYGVGKVACEALGRYYADRYGLSVVALRIGWLLDRQGLRERQSGDPSRARFARATWLSPRDCRALVARAALESLDETPVVVNAVSRNAERYLSLTETTLALGYAPRDDSAVVVDADANARDG